MGTVTSYGNYETLTLTVLVAGVLNYDYNVGASIDGTGFIEIDGTNLGIYTYSETSTSITGSINVSVGQTITCNVQALGAGESGPGSATLNFGLWMS